MPGKFIAPRRAVVVLGLAFGVAALIAASSCSSSSRRAGIAVGCSINSDCDGSLTCVFGLCHTACKVSKDCPGASCVPPGVCELPKESACSATLPCVAGLVCSEDICRAPCSPTASSGTTGGCLGAQSCVAVKSSTGFVCLDSSGDAGSIPNESGTGGKGSGAGGAASSGPPDASSASGAFGASGSADQGGDSSVGPTSCLSAQTQFGNVAMGDANPDFKSGVAARSANDLFIFDGYVGPDPEGDGGGYAINAVYVQAFDPKTGLSKGSAQPLFTQPSTIVPSHSVGTQVLLYSSAVAPTGQIVLVYQTTFTGFDSYSDIELYAAFLDSAAAGSDAGPAGLELKRVVHLATGTGSEGWPTAIWSDASQAFVISWMWAQPWFMQVDKFLAGGQSAGGSTDVVPTNAPSSATYPNAASGGVGLSGNLSGVAYMDTNHIPALTVLNSNGVQVGSSVDLFAASPFSVNSYADGSWVAVGGTAKGFVYFYDEPPTSVGGVFVPTSGATGSVDGYTDGGFTDGKDAGEFSRFTFTGATRAGLSIAIPDDAAGPGGVGVAIGRSNGLSFAYINADGVGRNGPNSVIAHTFVAGDGYSMTNFAGSFVVSLYSTVTRSTQAVASGCQ